MNQSIHQLFRANARYKAYFSEMPDILPLQKELEQREQRVLSLFEQADVKQVTTVELLTEPPPNAETRYGVSPEVRNIPKVRAKVLPMIMQKSNFSVDLVNIGFERGADRLTPSVFLDNPSEWM